MPYVTPDEIRIFCDLSEEECPDEIAEMAECYARGIIDDYCNCRFEDPGEDATYYYDGDGQNEFLAPDDHGPYQIVEKIEYNDGNDWVEYDGDYWIKADGEVVAIADRATPGIMNWRITGRCWKQLDTARTAVLKRVALMLCKLYLIPRDEPLGPSIRSISMEGVSYSYQPVNEGNPTGINEIDYLLRSLRRNVIRT